jgi:microcin C transport system substrate-binding protein
LLGFIGAAAALPAVARFAQAQGQTPARHGLSTFGDLKYGPDFRHFDYVNPAAPKGGALSTVISSVEGNQNFLTFDTLQIWVLKGNGAAGMRATTDSLMVRSLDEPDSLYGLVARSVSVSADGLVYRFELRPEARFHDGSPLRARDVAFSLNTLKAKGHPRISQAIRDFEAAEALDDLTVLVRFKAGRSRDVPLVVATLPILSSAYYEAREFDATSLEAPLGSGPYRVSRFETGRFIEFERVQDYWARDLPVTAGTANVDRLRYEYFRDRDIAFEAFTAGTYTFREEFTSRTWATRYDFPAFREGRVVRDEIPDETPSGAQGWFINLRRDRFADARVREAILLAFDYEWTNANLMYNAYTRTHSFFENSEMKASGPPSAAELALIEPFRGRIADEVFGEPFSPPKSDGSGRDRALLRRAAALLHQAGCRRDGATLRLPDGRPLEVEFLEDEPTLERHTNPFIANLGALGIRGTIRMVDPAQYQRRLDEFDFDLTVRRFSLSPTPGEAMRSFFGSEAAGTRGSQNLSGIAHPAVDALVDRALAATTRAELVTACRALDRVLRSLRAWVPHWYKGSHWLAWWDMYARPPGKPKFDRGAPHLWWYDEAKAKRIGKAG